MFGTVALLHSFLDLFLKRTQPMWMSTQEAQEAQAPPSDFEMEVVALDVGLHFLEVEGPEGEADKVLSGQQGAILDHEAACCRAAMQ